MFNLVFIACFTFVSTIAVVNFTYASSVHSCVDGLLAWHLLLYCRFVNHCLFYFHRCTLSLHSCVDGVLVWHWHFICVGGFVFTLLQLSSLCFNCAMHVFNFVACRLLFFFVKYDYVLRALFDIWLLANSFSFCYCIMYSWAWRWLLFPPPAGWVRPITTIYALSRFLLSDATQCSSRALAMSALLVRLLCALALSWSLALFTCGSHDFLKSWISTSACYIPCIRPFPFLGRLALIIVRALAPTLISVSTLCSAAPRTYNCAVGWRK